MMWPGANTEPMLAGRYLDRFERGAGVWKIACRKMICERCRTQDVADGWFAGNQGAYRANRTIEDSRLGWALYALAGQ